MLSKLFKNGRRCLPSGWVRIGNKLKVNLVLWNKWLQRKTQGVPLSRLRLYFSVIFLAFGLWNVWLTIMAFYRPAEIKMGDQIKMPQYVVKGSHGRQGVRNAKLSGGKEWLEFMDSLRGTQAGKLMVDSLDQARPGLLDSIADLERRFEASR